MKKEAGISIFNLHMHNYFHIYTDHLQCKWQGVGCQKRLTIPTDMDYRKLNEFTINEKNSSNISHLLDRLRNCEYLTSPDLADGIHESNHVVIQKTAFNIKNGHYKFLVITFCLRRPFHVSAYDGQYYIKTSK